MGGGEVGSWSSELPPVSRETSERLEHYTRLLEKWTKAINLIAPSTRSHIWRRHILDSAQVFQAASRKNGPWLDLGTGGGLPGVVCAIMGKECAPERRFILVESDARKSAFLATVSRELSLALDIRTTRIEHLDPIKAGTITARALAPLPKLLSFAWPHWSADTEGLFPKGSSFGEEIERASDVWRFKATRIQSITDSSACVLRIGDLQRV